MIGTIITWTIILIALRRYWVVIVFFGIIALGLIIDLMIEAYKNPIGEGGGIDVEALTSKPKVVKTTKTIVKKEVVKPTFKDEMRRFEEEAFWISVFEDEEL